MPVSGNQYHMFAWYGPCFIVWHILPLIGHNPSPEVFCAPYSGAQALQLDYLAVVYEQVYLRTVVFNIP